MPIPPIGARLRCSVERRSDVESYKVQGCASQVWLTTEVKPDGPAGPVWSFVGDSAAHIVRGLIAILFAVYSGKPAREILATDAVAVFERLGLREHLTPQRSNGFRSMGDRIRADARAALAEAARGPHAKGRRTRDGLGAFRSRATATSPPPAARPAPSAWPPARRRGRVPFWCDGYFRRRRCWPSPICLASCERAAA